MTTEPKTEWAEDDDQDFQDAVRFMKQDIDDGDGFETALEHYAALFGISETTLRHEWNLRQADSR